MKNRIFNHLAWMVAFAAIYSHSQTCNSVILYDGSSSNGAKIESSSMTFPEYPEWTANWGNFENMKSPYIRFSGQKNTNSDWIAAISFNQMPINVNGGSLKMKARATQNAEIALWVSGNFGTGPIYKKSITANQTSALELPISKHASGNTSIEKIWVSLLNVPTYQYTTLFIDDIELTCVNQTNSSSIVNKDGSSTNIAEDLSGPYVFLENVDFPKVKPSTQIYDIQEIQTFQQKTSNSFVLTEQQHQQIIEFQTANTLTPSQSREGWYNSLVILEHRRLKDGIIENPKNKFLDAGSIAASYDMRKIPLLLADLDYSYQVCADTMCTSINLENQDLLLAGFPTSYVNGSRIQVVYDPYFVVSTRKQFPSIEICVDQKCQSLKEHSEINLEFEAAGVQKITVKAKSGTKSTTQNLFLEVK